MFKDRMDYIILLTTSFPSLLICYKYNVILEINDKKKNFICSILIVLLILFNIFMFINIKYKISLIKTIICINIFNFFITILYMIYKPNIQNIYLILIPLLNIIYIYNKK